MHNPEAISLGHGDGVSADAIRRGAAGWPAAAVPFVAAAGLAAAGLLAAVLSLPPGDGEVAALFPPWWSASRAFASASSAGAVAATGALRSVLIVRSDRPALAERLRAAGALLVVAADGPFGCRSPLSPEPAR